MYSFKNPEKKSSITGRSVVMAKNGMVATSQPLASLTGIQILQQGGNAIDSAIASSAVLNVVEPMATGIGGDAFLLIYISKTRELIGLNGTGRAPYAATRDYFIKKGLNEIPNYGMLSVSVPGTLDAWVEALEKYGTMNLEKVLEPAIQYADEGFPVSEIISKEWQENNAKLSKHPDSKKTYLKNGNAPRPSEIFVQKDLANTFKKIAKYGKDIFYRGEIAEAIIKFSKANGGILSLKDFQDHTSTWVRPIKTNYRGFDIYELPPNGQGLTALMMLNIVEGFDLAALGHNSAEFLHILIESKKLAFADRDKYIADPEFVDIPVDWLLSKTYAEERRKKTDLKRASKGFEPGIPPYNTDTVYHTVVDKEGNVVSIISSLFSKFGSGMVADNTGICLQARAWGFNLEQGHFNCIQPHKRPFHTNIPAMMFKNGSPFMSFGVMGADMQPQGHLQVVANIIDFNMNVQEAVDAPRFRHIKENQVSLEDEIPENVKSELIRMGHEILPDGGAQLGGFGGAQAIIIDPKSNVLLGGSDCRKDGCAIGY